MKKKISVLVFIKSVDGGTGTFLLNLMKIKELSRAKDIEIKALILERPSFRSIEKHNFIYLRDKNAYPEHYSFSVFNIFSFFEELIWLKRQVSVHSPNVAIGVDFRCNIGLLFLKMLFFRKTKVIATTHIDINETIAAKSSYLLAPLLKLLIRLVYNKADALVCVSNDLSKSLRHNFNLKKKVKTIYNGFDKKIGKKKSLGNKKRRVVITIARLVEQKDHKTLIEAFSRIQAILPGVSLFILSNGPERRNLEKMVIKKRLSNVVKFKGWVKNIFTYLNRADIFVLSSKREGFNYSLVEAMSCGLPIVSTDTPFGPREVLGQGRYGLLVPVGDIEALKNGIVSILTDRKKYAHFSSRSIKRARDFSVESMNSRYLSLILTVNSNSIDK